MKNLSPEFKLDFERVLSKYNPSDYSESGGLSELDVVKAYYILSDYFHKEGEQMCFGIKNFNLLASAVARQEVAFDGYRKWTDEFDLMATLVYGLVKNHAFEDGNKRTALLALLLFLDKKGYKIVKPKTELENLIVRIAANELSDYGSYRFSQGDKTEDDYKIEFISERIRKSTKKKDKRIYQLTYREFDNKLREFGVCLDNPEKGFIKVYRVEQVEEQKTSFFKRLFRGSRDEREDRMVFLKRIPYKGKSKKVGLGIIKNVLQEAGLTEEAGVDSGVFFYGDEPEYVLIREYRDPLIRLKDK